jgi:hypothetical protein
MVDREDDMTIDRSILFPALVATCAACALAVVSHPASAFGVLIPTPEAVERCWIDRIQYTNGWYNATGHCEESSKRGSDYSVLVPFSAVGRYDAATHDASETIRVVKGGLDIPTHVYYGTITSTLSCGADPWQQAAIDCGVTSVGTTETIPQYFVDSLVRNRRRPFTSDLTNEQRAAVVEQYMAAIHRLHERVQEHPGTGVILDSAAADAKPASTMSAAGSGLAPSARSKEIGAMSALRAGGTTIRAPDSTADGHASGPAATRAALRTVEILEPAAGSTVRQGQLRVRIRSAAPGAETSNGVATVEFTALAPRAASPGPSSAGTAKVETWQVPLAQLAQGVLVPRNVSGTFAGPTLLRVRTSGTATWSHGVSFNIASDAQAQARTPTPPDWSSAAQPAAAPARLGNVPVSPGSAIRAPTSSFGH